jgi:cell division protease FtsH
MDTKWLKNSFIYLLIIVALIALFLSFFPQNGGKQTSQLSLSEVMQLAKQGQVKTITVEGDTLIVDRNDTNVQARAQTDPNTNLYLIFQANGVPEQQVSKIDVVYQKPAQFGSLLGLMVQFLP